MLRGTRETCTYRYWWFAEEFVFPCGHFSMRGISWILMKVLWCSTNVLRSYILVDSRLDCVFLWGLLYFVWHYLVGFDGEPFGQSLWDTGHKYLAVQEILSHLIVFKSSIFDLFVVEVSFPFVFFYF